jgi:hypothetical protein
MKYSTSRISVSDKLTDNDCLFNAATQLLKQLPANAQNLVLSASSDIEELINGVYGPSFSIDGHDLPLMIDCHSDPEGPTHTLAIRYELDLSPAEIVDYFDQKRFSGNQITTQSYCLLDTEKPQNQGKLTYVKIAVEFELNAEKQEAIRLPDDRVVFIVYDQKGHQHYLLSKKKIVGEITPEKLDTLSLVEINIEDLYPPAS